MYLCAAVSQACYGILKVPEGSWLCRICALGILPRCQLCPKKGGAMKPTRSGTKWVHVSCALWIPEVSYTLHTHATHTIRLLHYTHHTLTTTHTHTPHNKHTLHSLHTHTHDTLPNCKGSHFQRAPPCQCQLKEVSDCNVIVVVILGGNCFVQAL